MVSGRVKIGLSDLDRIPISAQERKHLRQLIETIAEERKRLKSEPAPQGGISLKNAEREYGINTGTLSRWVKKGLIPVLLRTKNWLYVDRSILEEVVIRYKKDPGRGKKTLLKL